MKKKKKSYHKDLTTEQYNSWLEKRQEAERSLTNRDTLLASSAELIETEFQLLGATGIQFIYM